MGIHGWVHRSSCRSDSRTLGRAKVLVGIQACRTADREKFGKAVGVGEDLQRPTLGDTFVMPSMPGKDIVRGSLCCSPHPPSSTNIWGTTWLKESTLYIQARMPLVPTPKMEEGRPVFAPEPARRVHGCSRRAPNSFRSCKGLVLNLEAGQSHLGPDLGRMRAADGQESNDALPEHVEVSSVPGVNDQGQGGA